MWNELDDIKYWITSEQLTNRRSSYQVAWTIVIHCSMACLRASSGKFSPSRMPQLDFSLELDEGNISRQFCVSCTGSLFRDVSTSNWHALSFRRCPAKAPTYSADDIHLVSEGPRRRLRLSTDRSCAVPRTRNTFGDRSFAAAGPRVWNSLRAHLYDEDIYLQQQQFQAWT